MAGLGRKVFTSGEILTAADLQGYAVDQSVMVFDDSAARGSAIPSPSEGMTTYLKDVDQVQVYNGSSFTPVGSVLQVVSTNKTNQFTTSSGSFVDVTGLSVSITPTATSSKVLVIADIGLGGQHAFARVSGGSVNYIGDSSGSRVRTAHWTGNRNGVDYDTDEGFFPRTVTYLDSPASTSTQTYKVQIASGGGVFASINRALVNTDAGTVGTMPSSITVMEIAG